MTYVISHWSILICHLGTLYRYGFTASGGGPSGPDDPRNIFLPSGKVRSRPFARFVPSFAWYPSTRISAPIGRSFLVKPRRRSVFGVPPSTIQRVGVPSAFFTST